MPEVTADLDSRPEEEVSRVVLHARETKPSPGVEEVGEPRVITS